MKRQRRVRRPRATSSHVIDPTFGGTRHPIVRCQCDDPQPYNDQARRAIYCGKCDRLMVTELESMDKKPGV